MHTPQVPQLVSENVDETLLNDLAELLGKVDYEEEVEESRSCSSNSENDKDKMEFRVCVVHNRKRAIDYLEEAEGEWRCVEGQVCKIPRATLKDEPKKKLKHWYCETCRMFLNSERQCVIHFEGGRHLGKVKDKKAQLLKKGIDYTPPGPRLCTENEVIELTAEAKRGKDTTSGRTSPKEGTQVMPTPVTHHNTTPLPVSGTPINSTVPFSNPFLMGAQPYPMQVPLAGAGSVMQMPQAQNGQYALFMLLPQGGMQAVPFPRV